MISFVVRLKRSFLERSLRNKEAWSSSNPRQESLDKPFRCHRNVQTNPFLILRARRVVSRVLCIWSLSIFISLNNVYSNMHVCCNDLPLCRLPDISWLAEIKRWRMAFRTSQALSELPIAISVSLFILNSLIPLLSIGQSLVACSIFWRCSS